MHRLLLAAALSLVAIPAFAQERTVRVISGYAAGGTGDLMARRSPNTSSRISAPVAWWRTVPAPMA